MSKKLKPTAHVDAPVARTGSCGDGWKQMELAQGFIRGQDLESRELQAKQWLNNGG